MKQIVSAALIGIGLVVLGLFIYCGFNSFANKDRQVVVRGLAEQEVMANKVTWPLVVKTVGNDIQQVYTQVKQRNATIIEFLKSNGIEEAEISLGAPSVWDKDAQTYRSDVPFRYNVTQVITVTSSQVETVNKLIQRQGDLLAVGVALSTDYQYNTTYEYTQLNEIKPAMIAEATKNAREAAQKFAEDSNSELGSIKAATQGQFSISDRDSYTPWIKNVRVVTTVAYTLKD